MNSKTLPRAGDKAVPRALVYLRVSTPRQMHTDSDAVADGNSIDTQRKEAAAKVKQLGAVLAEDGEYLEPGNSAQSIEKRPVFRAMLKRIMEQRDVEYVVVYMRSRAFRNALDALTTKYQLKKLGVKLVSAKEDFGEGIWADAMEAITDVVNEVQVRQNGEDIKVKMANKVANGGTPGKAKIGYLNSRIDIDGRMVNSISVDEERRTFVVMAFEEFATGKYNIERLRAKLTKAGFRTRASGRWKSQPISSEKLRTMLRDRYYCGYITFKGIEYKGRHESLISEQLFERVQRVLDSHQGAGVRERSHPHYLKGWLWCNRCGKRFIVQRAIGRHGGEYYYFFCTGRQDGICDHPYVPVEEMEQAIVRYYAEAVTFPADFRADIRALVDEAADDGINLTADVRQQFEKRLGELERKEDYLLDLAAEEGWPKDKLREKIGAIRKERSDIESSLRDAKQQLDAGRDVFYKALHLLDNPAGMYERGNEVVRTILNKAIFTRFLIDGRKVVGHELKEPFRSLDETYQRRQARTYYRSSGRQTEAPGEAEGLLVLPALAELEARWHGLRGGVGPWASTLLAERPTLLTEDGAAVELSLTDRLDLALALRARGSSKAVMVGAEGFEPPTPSV